MKATGIMVFLVSALLIWTGCNKDQVVNNLVNKVELTDNQRAELVAAQLSAPTGGVMAELQTLAAASKPEFYTFAKLDTSVSYHWVNYHLEMAFFLANGTEIPLYIPGVTDSITGEGVLSGDTTYASPSIPNATWDISLNRHSDMEVGQILTDTIRVNGEGADSSSLVYHGDNLTLTVQSASQFSVEAVRIPLNDSTFIPISGMVNGAVAGTISTDQASKNINIPYTVVFEGNALVTVTLTDSGKTFTVNLLTGDVTFGG